MPRRDYVARAGNDHSPQTSGNSADPRLWSVGRSAAGTRPPVWRWHAPAAFPKPRGTRADRRGTGGATMPSICGVCAVHAPRGQRRPSGGGIMPPRFRSGAGTVRTEEEPAMETARPAAVSRRAALTGLGAGGLGLALAARAFGAAAQEATPPAGIAPIELAPGVTAEVF